MGETNKEISCVCGKKLYHLIMKTISEFISEDIEIDRAFKDSKIFISRKQLDSLLSYNVEAFSVMNKVSFRGFEVVMVDTWLKSGILDNINNRFIPFIRLGKFDKCSKLNLVGETPKSL